MYLLFYKAHKGHFADYLISLFTWSKYSHVELSLKEPLILQDWIKFKGISASPRDKGTREKDILSKANKWKVIKVDEKIRVIPNDKKYDWITIFLGWLGLKSYNKTICSEYINQIFGYEETYITPKQLFKRYE
jgi:hypothetical protein